LIASSLSVTPAENRLFGETSDELKERARDTLSEGVQIAKTKAEEVYEAAVSQAGESGLNSERGREAVNEVGEMATDNLIAGERSKSKG
jgi:vacuolar-type H+-ATPase subunit H